MKGFTLLEILIVIVILGVVAGLAVPVFTSSIEQSRSNEAQNNLNAIYMGEKIYAVNHSSTYWLPPGGTTIPAINATLNLDLTAQYYTQNIQISAGGIPNSFTAQMARTVGGVTTTYCIDGDITSSGANNGKVYPC